MTAFAIRDFSADMSVDFARDFGAQKTAETSRRDFERPEDSIERASRDSDFDRALKDEAREKPRNDAPQRADDRPQARDTTRERAPEKDIAETPDPVEADAKTAPKERAQAQDTPEDAAPAQPNRAAAKPHDQKTQTKAGAGETNTSVLLEAQTTIVTPPLQTAANQHIVTQADDADALADGDGKSTKDSCALPAPSADATLAQTDAQADTQAGAQASALAALLNPQQAAQAQKSAMAPERTPENSAALEPALLGGPKTAKAPTTAAAQPDAQSASAPDAAPSAGFEAALSKQATAAPKKAEGQDSQSAPTPQNNASTASATAPQTAAQIAAKAQEAVSAKDATAAAKVEFKAETAQQAQGAALNHSAQRADEHRPLGAASTHATANNNAVAQHVVRFFRSADGGNGRFEIRLDPVELGRVDARVEMNPDKTVSLTLSADRPETLQELMRTARDLERQLTDSGVKLSDDGVKFRLNADAQSGQGWRDAQNQNGAQGRPARIYGEAEQDAAAPIAIKSWRAGGVDVWA